MYPNIHTGEEGSTQSQAGTLQEEPTELTTLTQSLLVKTVNKTAGPFTGETQWVWLESQ